MEKIEKEKSKYKKIEGRKYKEPVKMKAFLKQYEVTTTKENSHTMMSAPKPIFIGPGKWNIPDEKLEEFYGLYAKEYKKKYTFVERHKGKTSPIVIDIDIKQENKERQIKEGLIREMMEEIYMEMSKFINMEEENPIGYVLQRPSPYKFDENIYKDGLHIEFPYIVTEYEYQKKMRENLLEPLEEIKNKYNIKESIDNMYDDSVIERNGMMLYGSSKYVNGKFIEPYEITKEYGYEEGEMIEYEIDDETIEEILEILSLRNKNKTNCNEEYIKVNQEKEIIKTQENTTKEKIITKEEKITKDEMRELVELLDTEKMYKNWFEIGCIIRNEGNKNNEDWFDIYHDFSKEGSNYKSENDVKKQWDKLTGDGLTIKTLYKMLKEENKDYMNIKNKYKNTIERGNKEEQLIKLTKKHKKELNISDKEKLCETIINNENMLIKKLKTLVGNELVETGKINWINNILYKISSTNDKIYPEGGIVINITQNNYYNKEDDTINYEILEGHNIFDDRELNKLMINSLTESHKDIADIIYYLYKNKFNVTQLGIWYYYDEHRWKINKEDKLKRIIMEEIPKYYKKMTEYIKEKIKDKELVKKIEKIIKNIKSMALEENLMKCLKIIYYTENEDFEENLDKNPYLIGFKNGVYDLDKMEFRKGNPYDNISMSTGYNYNKDSKYDELDTMIEQILPIERVRHYVLKLLGYCLYGKNEIQKFFCWSGIGSNGKSVLLELLENTLGEYYTTIDISIMTQKRQHGSNANSELAKTKNKRVVTMSEPDVNDKLNIGLMKSLSGCDKITPREVYAKQGLSFVPIYKMILICNDLPKIMCNDKNARSVWRRIRNIKFISSFVEEPKEGNKYEYEIDETLSKNFDKWKVAFMNILIINYGIYKQEKLKDIPEIMESTNEYKEENDPIIEYKNEFIEYTGNEKDYIKWTILKKEYEDWYRMKYKMNISKNIKEEIENKIFDGIEEKPIRINDKTIRGWNKYKIINEYNCDIIGSDEE